MKESLHSEYILYDLIYMKVLGWVKLISGENRTVLSWGYRLGQEMTKMGV
jgi:hypothetical protein